MTDASHVAGMIAVALSAACGDASLPSDGHTWTTTPASARVSGTDAEGFGWTTPMTVQNADPVVGKKLGKAEATLAGHSLRQIVTDPTVKVRADNRACTECHPWAAKETRADFCARIPSFVTQPTSKGDGSDPENAKPQLLKNLLSKWHANGCP